MQQAVESMAVTANAQDDTRLLVAIGTFQAHPPTVDGFGLFGCGQGGGDIPRLLLVSVPDGQQADGHLAFFAVVGRGAPAALAGLQAQHVFG
jgi:hypothetical protein